MAEKDNFADICPTVILDFEFLVAATSEGHICLFDAYQNLVSSFNIQMSPCNKAKEKISCIAVSQDGKNVAVVTQISTKHTNKKCQLFWLQVDQKKQLGLVSKLAISESGESMLFDQITSV